MTNSNPDTVEKYTIVGLGNPLLDICAKVDQSFLNNYGLKLNNAILAEDKHLSLYEQLVSENSLFKVDYVAGGATQNSIRVAQWILKYKQPEATVFFGCIGCDNFGNILKTCVQSDGVKALYLENCTLPTGTCAVLIHEKERSLVANLGAANKFEMNHLELESSQKFIQKAKFFYTSGFHVSVCPDAMLFLAKHANENHEKVFAINLAAPFIVSIFTEQFMKLIPYCDYVFGNENEAAEFGKVQGWGDDLEIIATKLAHLPKLSGTRCRTVIFTQGHKNTLVYTQGKFEKYPVPPMNKSEIIDSNGAGDAFVGGFLAMLAVNKNISDCINAGHWAAQVILRHSGCTFPRECGYASSI